MAVGNDVVDLREPEARPGAVHPRFDERVFTSEERDRLAEAPLPARLRWTLWAAKESAFKAAKQLDPDLPFHPRRFAVRLLDDARAEVAHRMAGRFDVWVEEARDWVHAVAASAEVEARRPFTAREVLTSRLSDQESTGVRVRKRARRTGAPLLSLDSRELRVVMEDRIPRLFRRHVRLPLDLSLSHHGRVVACSWSGGEG